MDTPLLSIIVPAYNAEAYLDKCLTSLAVKEQTGRLEVVVINDGSTDQTHEIAQSFARLNPKIFSVVSQENGGHGAGIMTGISLAAGKYLRIIDADDWADTVQLAAFIARLETCESDIVLSPFTLIDMLSGKKVIKPIPRGIDHCLQLRVPETPGLFHYYDIHCLTVKTQLLREMKIELPHKTYYEDSEFVFKAAAGAQTVTCFPENIYQYLVGNTLQSMDADNMVRRYEQHDLILRRMLEAFGGAPENKQVLCTERIRTFALKQLIISLIYEKNRNRGRARAGETLALIKTACPAAFDELKKKAYTLSVFRFIGIRAPLWERLKKAYQRVGK